MWLQSLLSAWRFSQGLVHVINESDREVQIPYYFSYMWNANKQQQKAQAPKLVDTVNRLAVARGRRWGVGEMGEGDKSLYSSGLDALHKYDMISSSSTPDKLGITTFFLYLEKQRSTKLITSHNLRSTVSVIVAPFYG